MTFILSRTGYRAYQGRYTFAGEYAGGDYQSAGADLHAAQEARRAHPVALPHGPLRLARSRWLDRGPRSLLLSRDVCPAKDEGRVFLELILEPTPMLVAGILDHWSINTMVPATVPGDPTYYLATCGALTGCEHLCASITAHVSGFTPFEWRAITNAIEIKTL